MFNYMIFSFEKPNEIEYLDELRQDVVSHGVDVLQYNEMKDERMSPEHNPEHCLLLCDTEEAAAWAIAHGVGYLVYLTEQNQGDCFSGNLCVIEGMDEIDYEFLLHMYERSRGIPWTILETERCKLREITVSDVDRLYEIYQEPCITAYMEGLFENPEEERQFTRDYIRYMYGFFGFGLWLIIEKQSGRIIGRAGITNRDGFENLEIGYLIERSKQRQGFAEEVCRALLKYGRDKLGCERMNAFIEKENGASIALVSKLGFQWREEVVIEQKKMQRYEFDYS